LDKIIARKKKPHRELVFVSENATLDQVSQLLFQNSIISVPVFSASTPPKFLGFIDSIDFMKFVARDYFERQKQTQESLLDGFPFSSIGSITAGELLQQINRGVGDGVFDSTDTLQLAINALASKKRILVRMGDRNYIITQSDVIKYLHSIYDTLHANIVNTLVCEMKLQVPINDPGRIPTVSKDWMAIEAFFFMDSRNLDNVGIIDDKQDGKLIGNLSASDLRGVSAEKADVLKQPLWQFAQTMTGKPAIPPVTCTNTDTMGEVMTKAIQHRVHRIWIVNNIGCPIGLVTFTDVINTALTS
jgi:CBS domain-containing protein